MDDRLKVLIVDDDEHIAELISLYLTKEGYETKEVYHGRFVLEAVKTFKPNIIVLDIMLPGVDGYKLCSEIRKDNDVPIIMLTAKGETFDKVLGLELGSDDYMVKPFEAKELVARIKAILRRLEKKQEKKEDKNVITLPDASINIGDFTVIYYGENLDFPPKELELLYFLASHPNQVFTREQLLDKIWGYEYIGDTRTVDVHVKRVREKLNKDHSWGIKTVWGVGYKFEVK